MNDLALSHFGLFFLGIFTVTLILILAFKFAGNVHAIAAYATLALAVGTAALAFIALLALIDTRDAVQRGQEAFQLRERAFVVPSVEIMQPGPNEYSRLLVIPTFRNEGNTQTVELGVWLESNGLFPQGTYPPRLDPKTAARNKLWLGPKQSMSVEGLSMQVRRADVETYKADPSQYWLLYRGAFDYYDVLKVRVLLPTFNDFAMPSGTTPRSPAKINFPIPNALEQAKIARTLNARGGDF